MRAPHQFIDRNGAVVTEQLFGDRIVSLLYSRSRERSSVLLNWLTSRRASSLIAWIAFDLPLAPHLVGSRRFLERHGIDPDECVEPDRLDTPRRVFERKIRFWDCRPMPAAREMIVSPSDARVLIGSFAETSSLHVKGKLFDFEELLGRECRLWHEAFRGGDFAVFRLTPERYHYNHAPVSGRVVSLHVVDGAYHSCNPSALVAGAHLHARNRRVVTVIDTDVAGGTGVGLVAMIEVVALMIGDIVQCYSARRYDEPRPVSPGLFLDKGAVKSLYRPGSSTNVLIFQPERIRFEPRLLHDRGRRDVSSRYAEALGHAVAESEIRVREALARRAPAPGE
jgi:phosphatidylserine decarboxylase